MNFPGLKPALAILLGFSGMLAACGKTAPPPPPGCPIDNPTIAYCEVLADRVALDDLVSAYTVAGRFDTILAVNQRRYPAGEWLLTDTLNWQDHLASSLTEGNCATFEDLVVNFDPGFREIVYLHDFSKYRASNYKTRFYCTGVEQCLEAPATLTTFPISEMEPLLADEDKNNFYWEIAGSTQGDLFPDLLQQLNGYTHALYYGYQVADQIPSNRALALRDGVVWMMYYLESYLNFSATNHPEVLQAILEDAGYNAAVQKLWGRAEFILGITENGDYGQLGQGEAVPLDKVYLPENIATIVSLRDFGK